MQYIFPYYLDRGRERIIVSENINGYLAQLDDTLKNVLSGLSTNIDKVKSVLTSNGEEAAKSNDHIYSIAIKLREEEKEKLDELKSEIIATASSVTDECKSYTDTRESAIEAGVASNYVAVSDFGTYSDTIDARITLAEGNIASSVEEIEKVNNKTTEIENTTKSMIEQYADSISSTVESNFISKEQLGEHESLAEYVSSRVTQTESSVTDFFSNAIIAVSNELENITEGINEYIEETNAYIRRGELETDVYGIEIGRSDSNIKTRFLNDRISFYQGEVEVAYISDNSLYITRAEILDYLKLGNSTDGYFTFDVSQNGLELRWNQ